MGLPTCIALVTQPTRLEGLVERWSTKSAAKFRFKMFRDHEQQLRKSDNLVATESLDAIDDEADFMLYEQEDESYRHIVRRLRDDLSFDAPVVVVEKEQLPNFMFMRALAVVVVGQDGLVANTAKYAEGLPIIGVNPDPARNDGVLLPFGVDEAAHALRLTLEKKSSTRQVTLAEAELNDGQKMLAFNDFFVGRAGHASARYTLRIGTQAEPQSSSGVLVSTGAGATGWMSSVLNMTAGVAARYGMKFNRPNMPNWEDRRLTWAVREPFQSRHSSSALVHGEIDDEAELVVESLMPEQGVVFSDGIEHDCLEFNSGSIARIRVARQVARLVVS